MVRHCKLVIRQQRVSVDCFNANVLFFAMKTKSALTGCAAFLLTACVTGPNDGPAFTYSEIEVINNSVETIQSMTITVTGRVTDCGDIVALGICSERFGRRSYTQAPFVVEWTFGNKPRQTDEIEIAVPAYNAPGNPLYVELEISPEGALSASLVQKIPP
jgi:hypothetical protein